MIEALLDLFVIFKHLGAVGTRNWNLSDPIPLTHGLLLALDLVQLPRIHFDAVHWLFHQNVVSLQV